MNYVVGRGMNWDGAAFIETTIAVKAMAQPRGP